MKNRELADFNYECDTDFNLNRFRIWARKQVDDKATVTFRLGKDDTNNVRWERYFLTLQLPYDMVMNAGLYLTDWRPTTNSTPTTMLVHRSRYGRILVHQELRRRMFQAFVAISILQSTEVRVFLMKVMNYGARFRWNFNENFWLSGNYIAGITRPFSTSTCGGPLSEPGSIRIGNSAAHTTL